MLKIALFALALFAVTPAHAQCLVYPGYAYVVPPVYATPCPVYVPPPPMLVAPPPSIYVPRYHCGPSYGFSYHGYRHGHGFSFGFRYRR